jgi:transposase
MVALLLCGYSRGLYSSRQLARACEARVDVMAVTGLNRPNFRTITDFRKRHLVALADLFMQVLRLCRAAGLVGFAHVAVGGTKLEFGHPSRGEAAERADRLWCMRPRQETPPCFACHPASPR